MLERIPLALFVACVWFLIWMGAFGMVAAGLSALVLAIGLPLCERLGSW